MYTPKLRREADGWRSQSSMLADFFTRFVNRHDVWGAYWPEQLRQDERKVYTAPVVARRGVEFLTRGILQRHFVGADVGDVVGLHASSPEGLSRWCGIDFDAHPDASGNLPTSEYLTRVRNALDWFTDVLGERLSLLIEDSNGNGGFHLWAYFDQPVPTSALFAWLQELASECNAVVGIRPETYPKQGFIPIGGFGSWLRLPGRHHTKAHWSRVCRPGEEWVSGEPACDTIVRRWPPTPADAIPILAANLAAPSGVVATTKRIVETLRDTPRNRAKVIAAYVRKLPHGDAGTQRSDKLFSLARFLRHGMQCSEAEALPVLRAWDTGNRPPLGEKKIRTTWQNASRYAARGVQLKCEDISYAA